MSKKIFVSIGILILLGVMFVFAQPTLTKELQDFLDNSTAILQEIKKVTEKGLPDPKRLPALDMQKEVPIAEQMLKRENRMTQGNLDSLRDRSLQSDIIVAYASSTKPQMYVDIFAAGHVIKTFNFNEDTKGAIAKSIFDGTGINFGGFYSAKKIERENLARWVQAGARYDGSGDSYEVPKSVDWPEGSIIFTNDSCPSGYVSEIYFKDDDGHWGLDCINNELDDWAWLQVCVSNSLDNYIVFSNSPPPPVPLFKTKGRIQNTMEDFARVNAKDQGATSVYLYSLLGDRLFIQSGDKCPSRIYRSIGHFWFNAESWATAYNSGGTSGTPVKSDGRVTLCVHKDYFDGQYCSDCGNGETDKGEECDDGVANSNTEKNRCRLICKNPWCGDGVPDSGEKCDEGGKNDDTPSETPQTVCRTTCKLGGCGDGIEDLNGKEECDTGDVCKGGDYKGQLCNTIEAAEKCFSGGGICNSDTMPSACRTNCKNATCGDAVTDSREGCDDGNKCDGGDINGRPCDTPDEQQICFDGGGKCNSDTVAKARCRTDCTSVPCGNGKIDSGEQCDKGSANNNNPSQNPTQVCRTTCKWGGCGDGIIDLNGEQCDNGANNDDERPDACRKTGCKNPQCGDGVRDPKGSDGKAGTEDDEECEDGNNVNTDGCIMCKTGYCGDGYTLTDLPEEGSLKVRYFTQPGGRILLQESKWSKDDIEQCDDGNDNNKDGCLNNCKKASCGDGYVNYRDEVCDMGPQGVIFGRGSSRIRILLDEKSGDNVGLKYAVSGYLDYETYDVKAFCNEVNSDCTDHWEVMPLRYGYCTKDCLGYAPRIHCGDDDAFGDDGQGAFFYPLFYESGERVTAAGTGVRPRGDGGIIKHYGYLFGRDYPTATRGGTNRCQPSTLTDKQATEDHTWVDPENVRESHNALRLK